MGFTGVPGFINGAHRCWRGIWYSDFFCSSALLCTKQCVCVHGATTGSFLELRAQLSDDDQVERNTVRHMLNAAASKGLRTLRETVSKVRLAADDGNDDSLFLWSVTQSSSFFLMLWGTSSFSAQTHHTIHYIQMLSFFHLNVTFVSPTDNNWNILDFASYPVVWYEPSWTVVPA